MNLDLLHRWLALPQGPWPPDHYTLLALPRGEGDVDTVEAQALERMELLRTYQLLHDQEVTEGMNRLAQAMVCLCDPVARREYDRSLGLPVEETSEDAEPTTPESELDSVIETDTGEEAPLVLQYVDGLEPIVPELVDEEAEPDEGIILSLDELPPDSVDFLDFAEEERRQLRRELYARLTTVRRAARIWERLRPYLSDPEHPVSQRAEAQELTEALTDLREVLPDVADDVGEPGEPGHRVAILARQQLILHTFRSLLPSQRIALAEDWKEGRLRLRKRRILLRQEVRDLIVKPWGHRTIRPLLRRMARAPEWTLLATGTAALLIAAVRGW